MDYPAIPQLLFRFYYSDSISARFRRSVFTFILISVLAGTVNQVTAQTVTDSVRVNRSVATWALDNGTCAAGVIGTWPDVAARVLDEETTYNTYRLVVVDGSFIPRGNGEIVPANGFYDEVPAGHYGHDPRLPGGAGPCRGFGELVAAANLRVATGSTFPLNGAQYTMGDWYATYSVPDGTPIAEFIWSQTEGLTVAFDGSLERELSREVTADGPVPVESYEWDFGDGNEGFGATPQHTYAEPGTYSVSLTVTDDDGETDTATYEVDVAGAILAYTVSVPERVLPGDTLNVEIAITNEGIVDAAEVTILRDLAFLPSFPTNPEGFRRNAQASSPLFGTGDTTITAGLAVGATLSIKQAYVIDLAGFVNDGTITEVPVDWKTQLVEISGEDIAGRAAKTEDVCTQETCDDTVRIQPVLPPELFVSTVASPNTIGVGAEFDLYVIVRNGGEGPAEEVRTDGLLAISSTNGGAARVISGPDPTVIEKLEPEERDTLVYRVEAEAEGILEFSVPVVGLAENGDAVSATPECIVAGKRLGNSMPQDNLGPVPCGAEIVESIVVTTTGDDENPTVSMNADVCDVDPNEDGSQCTLRAAIMLANERAEAVQISFDIPGDGTPRIVTEAPLPSVTATVRIDGATQPGSGRVDVDFAGADPVRGGIELAGDSSAVERIAFLKAGVAMEGDGITVARNRFGQNWAGTATREEAFIDGSAISVSGKDGTVGGEGAADIGNSIVYANTGIFVRGDDATIESNIIGDPNLMSTVENIGIYIQLGENALVTFNDIIGVGGAGVFVEGFSVSGAVIADNVIFNGQDDGIRVEGGAGVTIGGDIAGDPAVGGNTSQSNAGWGISIVEGTDGSTTMGDAIRLLGNRTENNEVGGLRVRGVSNVVIDGTENRFADGVSLLFADGTVVQGSTISDERNTPSNPLLVGSSEDVLIGGLSEVEGNKIIGSQELFDGQFSAVLIESSSVRFEGNTIGEDGATAFHGISIDVGSEGTIVAGNTIRLHAGAGVRVFSPDVVIGGIRPGEDCAGPCNNIAENTEGVRVEADGTRILGNDITTNNDAVVVLADDVVIGGPSEALTGTCSGVCNAISGNVSAGVVAYERAPDTSPVEGTGANRLVVQGNFIGQTPAGDDGNGTGVELAAGGQNNIIGARVGEADGTRGNVFVGNVNGGVIVEGTSTTGNTIRVNSFLRNGILNGAGNIDLKPEGEPFGRTPNDVDDSDIGPNGLLNWPTLVVSEPVSDTQWNLLALWSGDRTSAQSTYRIDVYANQACRGWASEGAFRVAGVSVSFPRADAAFDTVSVSVPRDPSRPYFGATITDAEGNTSEFGNCIRAGGEQIVGITDLDLDERQEIGEILLTLRERALMKADVEKTKGQSGAEKANQSLPLYVVEYESEVESDTLFVPEASAIPPGGTFVQPGSLVGSAWRLAAGALPPGRTLDVCLPTASLDAETTSEVLLVARGSQTNGRWLPHDTNLETVNGLEYACAESVGTLGEVTLALQGLPVATEEEPELEMPAQITLDQNYPNPFNPQTVIPYSLSSSGRVQIGVYDLLGRRVQTLVDAVMPAGRHQVTFDAGKLSSGMYIYQLQTGSTRITRRMMLIK